MADFDIDYHAAEAAEHLFHAARELVKALRSALDVADRYLADLEGKAEAARIERIPVRREPGGFGGVAAPPSGARQAADPPIN
jgi:hypothetical protein